MKLTKTFITSLVLLLIFSVQELPAQNLMTNVYGRNVQSLNGKWDAIIDLYDQGRKNKIYLEAV